MMDKSQKRYSRWVQVGFIPLLFLVFSPSLSEASFRLGASGNVNYALLSYNSIAGKMGFGGGLHFDFEKPAKQIEFGFGLIYRKHQYGYESSTIDGSVNGFMVPLIARYNLSRNFSLGGGVFYWIVTTEGCFDDNDYGVLATARFKFRISNSTKFFVEGMYLHGTQSCFLFGGESLNSIMLSVGISFRAFFSV